MPHDNSVSHAMLKLLPWAISSGTARGRDARPTGACPRAVLGPDPWAAPIAAGATAAAQLPYARWTSSIL